MRVPLKETILTAFENQLFKAMCLDISAGGCMIKVPRGRVPVDSIVKIHIYNNDTKNCPAFSLKGKVIRIIPQGKTDESDLFDHLGVEFENGEKFKRDALQSTLRNMIFNYKEKEKKVEDVFKRAS